MLISLIEARIFYKFKPDEIRQLGKASLPLASQIRAVATDTEHASWRSILKCEYFRAKEAAAVNTMLIRAGRYTRQHLDEYFPQMRQSIIADTEHFEEAVTSWWQHFLHDQRHVTPTP